VTTEVLKALKRAVCPSSGLASVKLPLQQESARRSSFRQPGDCELTGRWSYWRGGPAWWVLAIAGRVCSGAGTGEISAADRLASEALAAAGWSDECWRCRLSALLSSRWERSRVPWCKRSCDWLMLASESESHCDWRSVSLSWCRAPWPDIHSSLKVTVLSIWGALSDERSGLSFVSHSQLSVVQIFTILQLLTNCMYNIYKASVSPGSVQLITSLLEARIFIRLPLGGARTNWRWSCSYERELGSACVDVQRARLQAVMYKYRLLLLCCGSCLSDSGWFPQNVTQLK
jgi:hypothetical protein